jgi:hypothetical protein
MDVELAEFSDLIDRYTADFVGRDWLVTRTAAHLADPACRFVVLTGDPGVGKTAFMARLAATHPDWLRYFIRRDSRELLSPGDAKTFLLTIGGQFATLRPDLFHPENLEIVIHQDIGEVTPEGRAVGAVVEELDASPFYKVAIEVEQRIRRLAGSATGLRIGRLVTEPRLLSMQDLQYLGLLYPARLLLRRQPAARVVVLVDALDELRYSPAGSDVLRVLRQLPGTATSVASSNAPTSATSRSPPPTPRTGPTCAGTPTGSWPAERWPRRSPPPGLTGPRSCRPCWRRRPATSSTSGAS